MAAMGTQAELRARWAALCQPRQRHVASEQVPIRLRRINLYSPVSAGPGVLRAPGVPLPRAAVLLQLPCQRLHNLPSILIRFSTSPSPAHSSPNAGGAGRSHDMVSNQLLNSDFSWLSLEEASRSLCLVLPEQGAALWLPLMPRWPAMPVSRGPSGSVPRVEAAGRPYKKHGAVWSRALARASPAPTDPATRLPGASQSQGRQVLGLPRGAAVLCRCCCFPGAHCA